MAVGQIKRRIFGEKIVKGIRFPVMTHEEFASVVLDSKILTLDEVSDMFKWFAVKGTQVGFPVSKRGAILWLVPGLSDVSDLAQWCQVKVMVIVY